MNDCPNCKAPVGPRGYYEPPDISETPFVRTMRERFARKMQRREEEIETLQEEVAKLKKTSDDFDSALNEREAQIDELEQEVDALKEQLAKQI